MGNATLRIDTRRIQAQLRTKKLGRSLLTLDRCRSTNKLAAELAKSGAPEGLAIISDEQTEGTGRHGSRWLSPQGGIWMSVVLRPRNPDTTLGCLPSIGALAVAQSIDGIHHVKASVRWPNDVVVNDRKLAGTLAEGRFSGRTPEYIVLGLGIDSNFPSTALDELGIKATTLSDAIGHPIDREELSARILFELERLYQTISVGRDSEVIHSLMCVDSSAGRRLTIHLERETVTGVFEKYLTLTKIQILDDHNNHKQIETSAALSVEYQLA